jgi:hypothetical protein
VRALFRKGEAAPSGQALLYGSFLYLKEKSFFQEGKQIFFASPQIANPQITIQLNFLGVPARKLQIRIQYS